MLLLRDGPPFSVHLSAQVKGLKNKFSQLIDLQGCTDMATEASATLTREGNMAGRKIHVQAVFQCCASVS